ncbi:hypothetical protein ACTT2I_08430 [Stenotrophomonas sp. PUT21]|uniref:hypothetical protein n=1 Tax=Stenotrophomonas TaxID=40323 RepID=UPI003B79E7E1
MPRLHTLVIAACLMGFSALASAETVNLTYSAEEANRDAGISAAKKKLQVNRVRQPQS